MHLLSLRSAVFLLAGASAVAQSASGVPLASLAYVLQADALAKSRPQAVRQLAACGRDWVVLDATFTGDEPWECTDLAAIRAGRAGRKVIAYLSVGEAEDYRPYWHPEWLREGQPAPGAPAFLGLVNPAWKGNYRVKYWHADWQKIMLTAVDDAMSRGFDGVYLDIVDGFEFFEEQGGKFIDDRVNPETQLSYRRDMIDWVKTIAIRARTHHPAALVVPQNGAQLLAHPDFLAAINAIGVEDLFTDGDKLRPRRESDYIAGYLAKMSAAVKPVLLIEYPKKQERKDLVKQRAAALGFVWLLTDRQLRTLGESGR